MSRYGISAIILILLTAGCGGGGSGAQLNPGSGDYIAFVRIGEQTIDGAAPFYGDVMVVDARVNVGAVTRLTNGLPATDPVWSYDGTVLAFRYYETGGESPQSDIYSVNVGTGESRRLTTSPAYDGDPAFSPDGTEIVFSSGRGGLNSNNLFIMTADGQNVRRLTEDIDASNTAPLWSPDGQWILFTSQRMDNIGSGATIDRVAPDGTQRATLINCGDRNCQAVWSPDSSQIAYRMQTGQNQNAIHVINADGSDDRQLTDPANNDSRPVWSPDGAQIVFQSFRDDTGLGDSAIYIMNADGTDQRVLADLPGADTFAGWSPDGTRVVFLSGPGIGALVVVDLNGGEPAQLTMPDMDSDQFDTAPVWRP